MNEITNKSETNNVIESRVTNREKINKLNNKTNDQRVKTQIEKYNQTTKEIDNIDRQIKDLNSRKKKLNNSKKTVEINLVKIADAFEFLDTIS